MKFENTEVFNWEGAIRGMRNPLESWDKSDSFPCINGSGNCEECRFYTHDIENFGINEGCLKEEILDECKPLFVIGLKDLELMQTLIKSGTEHRKFMRQIFVSVDITAPLYWWKEFDTYKVGTVANSTSTMHKLASTPITMDCFEMDDFESIEYISIDDNITTLENDYFWKNIIKHCEALRQKYNKVVENKKHLEEIKEFEEAKKAQVMAKKCWKELIRLLPESWLQKRTVTMNYENLLAMCSKGQRRFHKLTEWSKSFIDWARSLPYAQELIFLDENVSKNELA